MKNTSRKLLARVAVSTGLLVLIVALTGETCTVDKDVEVTVAAEVIAHFEARGVINTFEGTQTVNIATDADLQQILADNGFEDQIMAYIEGAFVRVVKRDANATNRTVTGTVTLLEGTGGGSEVNLILNRSAAVNDSLIADWTPVPLEAAGVSLLNEVLASYLTDLYMGAANPRIPVLTFHSVGVSNPTNVMSDFDWEVKVIMTLVGTKTVTVVDPI